MAHRPVHAMHGCGVRHKYGSHGEYDKPAHEYRGCEEGAHPKMVVSGAHGPGGVAHGAWGRRRRDKGLDDDDIDDDEREEREQDYDDDMYDRS